MMRVVGGTTTQRFDIHYILAAMMGNKRQEPEPAEPEPDLAAEEQEWEEQWLLLSKMPLLQTLDESERGKIAEVLEAQQIEPGQPIVTMGEAGDAMYFLEAGEAVAEVQGEVVKRYARGDYFGERALLRNETRAATVRAGDDGARCLKLARSSFEQFKSKLDRSVLAEQEAMYGTPTSSMPQMESRAGFETQEDADEEPPALPSRARSRRASFVEWSPIAAGERCVLDGQEWEAMDTDRCVRNSLRSTCTACGCR